ncbi:MAG: S8 family serine peptidase [Syntrophotaleaceae bacterium]
MKTTTKVLILCLLSAALSFFPGNSPAAPAARIIEGQYLILLDAPVSYGLAKEQKAGIFQDRQNRLLQELKLPESKVLRRYSHLPMLALQLPETADLDRVRKNARVRAIYPNRVLYHQLTESLPLIRQSLPAELGYGGQGTTIAIIDTGLDYTRPEFGSCTAPGTPAECRVAAALDIATNDGTLDDIGHGTHVGSIAAAVAPNADLVALDVFSDGTSSDALLISAINWSIAHQEDYNIVALNLSLGDGVNHTSPCSSQGTNPYITPVANARAAGIVVVAAAGNQGYDDGLNSPACTPDIVSVGAVYDAAGGGIAYSACTDSSRAADQIACFSNSADFLTMLAPGALITAAGSTKAGTSQAAPHVAGAAAVLRSAYPLESVSAIIDRLTTADTMITDPRNGVSLPRLDEQLALGVEPEAVPAGGLLAISFTAIGMILLAKNTSHQKPNPD